MVRFRTRDRRVIEQQQPMRYSNAMVLLPPGTRYLNSGIHRFCFRILSSTPDAHGENGLAIGVTDGRLNPAHIAFNSYLPRSRRCWFYQCQGRITEIEQQGTRRYGRPYGTGHEVVMEIVFEAPGTTGFIR